MDTRHAAGSLQAYRRAGRMVLDAMREKHSDASSALLAVLEGIGEAEREVYKDNRTTCDRLQVYLDGDTLKIDDGDTAHSFGVQSRNDGESWRYTYRIPRDQAKGNMRRIWSALGNPSAYYGGPGQAFSNGPCVYREGRHWIIEQGGGLDI